MTDVFLSYCRRDTSFVLQLKQDIEKQGYTTWMDNDRIHGGDQWEKEIEEALAKTKLFIVVVSKDSNTSNWVQRETIRAEFLQKTRIPILLNTELPLRLLDLQYVDFRGAYQGGIADLYPLLEKNLGQKGTSKEIKDEADRLIGAAVRALLTKKHETANEMLQRVIQLRPTLAQSPADLWNRISRSCNGIYPTLQEGSQAQTCPRYKRSKSW